MTRTIVTLGILAMLGAASTNAQDVTVDAQAVVDVLARRITDFYVIPTSADQIVKHIRDRLQNGDYDHLSTRQALAQQLTQDLREASNDAHFAVVYDTSLFAGAAPILDGLNGPDSRAFMRGLLRGQVDDGPMLSDDGLRAQRRRNNYLTAVEILPGNVGYLKLEQMPELGTARSTVDAAMAFLANTDAVLLDVRENPGGVGGFIPYLMSYFFDVDSVALYRRDYDAIGFSDTFYTYKTLPGTRLPDLPLYVLIDQFTGSAARNLAYTLQSFDRATLVGEATGTQGNRGAHSAGLAPLADGLVALIPFGRVVNARTGTNWRDDGVHPDLPAMPDDARDVAYRAALESLLGSVSDAAHQQELRDALSDLDRADPPAGAPSADDLSEFVGRYGVREITLVGGVLRYGRDGMSVTLAMEPIGEDKFDLVLPPNAQSPGPAPTVRFDRNAAGVVIGFSLLDGDGNVTQSATRD